MNASGIKARSIYLRINGKTRVYRPHPHRLASGTRSDLATSYIDTNSHLQAVSPGWLRTRDETLLFCLARLKASHPQKDPA